MIAFLIGVAALWLAIAVAIYAVAPQGVGRGSWERTLVALAWPVWVIMILYALAFHGKQR